MSRTLIQEGLIALKEVFNRPYRVKEVESFNPDELKYNAYTDDGRLVEVFVELVDADYSFLKGFGAFNPDIAKKHKWKPNQMVGKLDFAVEEDFAISGEGDAPRIFATVIEAVKQSMNSNRNLVGFVFTGFERSRARLYTTMVRRLSRQYNLEPIVLKNITSDATGHPGMYAFVGNPRRAPWMFVDKVREK